MTSTKYKVRSTKYWALGLLMAAPTLAAVPAAQNEQRPVFRSRAEIYEIEVTVLDRNREPVRGLTAADFTLTEAGRPVRISQFSEVELPAAEGTLPQSAEIESPDLRSDQYADRRLIAIVLDDYSLATWPGAFAVRTNEIVQEVKDATRGILQALGPKDFATVLFTMSPRISPDFTSSWAKLTGEVAKFKVQDGLVRNEISMTTRGFFGPAQTIRETVAYLSKLPQHSKTIVYVGRPMPGYFPVYPLRLDDVIDEAKNAGIAVYGFDPHGPLDRSLSSFLVSVTERTGGGVWGPNNLTQGIPRVFAETRGYYLLGFEPIGLPDGKFHRLQLKVNRPGVRVRAPAGYTAAAKSDIIKPDPLPFDPELDSALKQLSATAGRKLFAYATVSDGRVRAVAELELVESGLPAWTAGADVDVEVTSGPDVVARGRGRIEPGVRGAIVDLSVTSVTGPLRVNVVARAGGATLEDSTAPKSGGTRLDAPRVVRTTSLPRAPLGPVADFRFRQTEQLRIEWPELSANDRRQVRLLRRSGEPVGPVPTSIVPATNGRSHILVTLPLATVAPGEYLIEAIVGNAASTERQLFAFRVIQ